MIKKHAIIYSAILHILLVMLIFILRIERKKETDDSPVYLDYTFFEKEIINEEQEPVKPMAVKKIPLPAVKLPNETKDETFTPSILPDITYENTQSLVVMPKDILTASDSVLLINPNMLTLRTFLVNRIAGNMPVDTSKKWTQIQQIGMDEYFDAMKYNDGFNNAGMQEKYNSGGIRFSLGSFFDLFSSNKDTVISYNNLPSGIRAYRDPEIYTESKKRK